MNTTSIGRRAESLAANHLRSSGFRILAQNWRTRRCEIDLVALKDATIYFVEVKYRSTAGQGVGGDYVTKAKQRQMNYAAQTWIANYDWTGSYVLSVASINTHGDIEFIDSIT